MKRRNEVLVGMLVVVVAVVGIAGTMWLAQRGFSSSYPLHTRLSWGAGIKQGAQVLLAGVQVGFVDELKLNREGYVDVTMSIDSDYQVPEGTLATVETISIFGDKAVALKPTRVTPSSIRPGDTVQAGASAPSIDDLIARADTVSRSVGDVAKTFEIQMVKEGGIEELRKTVASTNVLVQQLNRIAAEQSRGLTQTLTSLRRTVAAIDSARLDSTLASAQQATQNLQKLTNSFQQTATTLDSVARGLQAGQGTAGKLLKDSTLYADLRMLVTRIDSLTADFKKNPRRYINLKIF